MTIYVHPDVEDGYLNVVKTNATLVTLCKGQPATRTEAVTDYPTGKKLADVAVSSADWTLADHASTGRKATLVQKTGVPVDVSDTADHFAVVDGTRLLAVKPLATPVALLAGNTVTINGVELRVPEAVSV